MTGVRGEPRLADQPRIVVVGTSGSGKTTLARRIATLTGRKHVELDALYWGLEWTPKSDFQERVAAEAQDEEWVVDGNYSRVRELLWARATAAVWLNYPFFVVLYRITARTLRRLLSKEILFEDNRESFRSAFLRRDGIFWWALRTFRRRRREYTSFFADPRFRHLAVFELRSPREAERLLQRDTRA